MRRLRLRKKVPSGIRFRWQTLLTQDATLPPAFLYPKDVKAQNHDWYHRILYVWTKGLASWAAGPSFLGEL